MTILVIQWTCPVGDSVGRLLHHDSYTFSNRTNLHMDDTWNTSVAQEVVLMKFMCLSGFPF